MLYKNTKAMFRSPDRDTDFVTGVLQGDPLPSYLFVLLLDNVLRIPIDLINCFFLKKSKNRRYPTKSITDEDYADYQALLVNTLTQAKS